MFSGIVEETAEVVRFDSATDPARLILKSSLDHTDTRIGDSICVSGVCLTVIETNRNELTFDISQETLRRSTLGALSRGERINLERSVKYGDRLHGHLVSGHVDTVSHLISREAEGGSDKLVFSIDPATAVFLAEKGSISVAGVSLTIGEVTNDSFAVYIIPHTADVTTIRELKPGDKVNIEVDMLARYVHRILKNSKEPDSTNITEGFLSRHGYIKTPLSGRGLRKFRGT